MYGLVDLLWSWNIEDCKFQPCSFANSVAVYIRHFYQEFSTITIPSSAPLVATMMGKLVQTMLLAFISILTTMLCISAVSSVRHHGGWKACKHPVPCLQYCFHQCWYLWWNWSNGGNFWPNSSVDQYWSEMGPIGATIIQIIIHHNALVLKKNHNWSKVF